MSACPSCNSLYSHAPGCRATRPGGPAFGEELTRVFARAIDAACRLDTNPQTVRPAVEVPYQPTVAEQAMMSAEMEAREINEMMTGRPILDRETIKNMVSEGTALREAIEKRLDPMLSGKPPMSIDEPEPQCADGISLIGFPFIAGLPYKVPTMDLAKTLPDGYWWCEECSASREKGHSCYERKSW